MAAALHLACIAGGPAWYRTLGAGEMVAQAAAGGRAWPALATLGIAITLALFAVYAASGAGLLPRLPLLLPGLVIITLVYCARGLVLFYPSILRRPDLSPGFLLWSSAIVLIIGVIHLAGLWLGWSRLIGER